MKRKGVLSLIIGLLALRPVSAEKMVTLRGHVSPYLKTATKLERVPADERIDLTLAVRIDQKLLDQAIADMYGPGSPKNRHYLTPSEFSEKFGLAKKRKKLREFAAAHGLTINSAEDRPESMSVKVFAGAGQVEKTFNIQLHHYRDAKGRIFHAHETDPMIPASLVPHLGAILGLSNNADVAEPHLKAFPVSPKASSAMKAAVGAAVPALQISGGNGPNGTLAPQDIKSIYGLNPVAQTGTGQTVALFELDGYNPADIAAYESQFQLPNVPVTFVGVDGTTNLCGYQSCTTQSAANDNGMIEVALDIEMVAALAPNVTNILVYDDQNTFQGVLDTYNQIAVDGKAQIVSTSWGLAEQNSGNANLQSEYQIFQRMALQGQTIYAASGDNGAYGSGPTLGANDPASQPYMTSVGGTSLTGSIQSPVEAAWGGSGGGVSGTWALPDYQASVIGLASEQYRNVPDVALNADPLSGYAVFVGGGWWQVGGTSAAAPLWAGLTALINQQRAASGVGVFGFANPTLYQLGNGNSYHSLFNDITTGTNGSYQAAAGYDEATGFGSFKGSAMISAASQSFAPVLTVLISSPTSNQFVLSPITVTGSAQGPNFANYRLEYGLGTSPSTWTLLNQSSQPVNNGMLGTFDPSTINSQFVTLRLTAFDLSGQSFATVVVIQITGASFSTPQVPSQSNGASVYKPGSAISINGSALAANFQNYQVQWAVGINPSSGSWSNAGVSLMNGGLSPVIGGPLATWATPGGVGENYYTIRLLVNRANETITVNTLVLLEPALTAASWPLLLPRQGPAFESPYPMHDATGVLQLAAPGNLDFFIVSPQGTLLQDVYPNLPFSWNGSPPAVGDFDGLPGDKALMGGNSEILQVKTNGTFSALYSDPNQAITTYPSAVLTDLKGDGKLENLFFVTPQTVDVPAHVHALMANGQELTSNFPIAVQDDNIVQDANGNNRILAVDLNRTGQKEIFIVNGTSPDPNDAFTLKAYKWDGTPYSWPVVTYSGQVCRWLAAADLDHNGTMQIIVLTSYVNSPGFVIYVYNADGTLRPGWPVSLFPQATYFPFMALADLDGDGKKELVVSAGSLLDVLRSNGQTYSNAWPHDEGANHYFGPIAIADANGDGRQDIFVDKDDLVSDPWTANLTAAQRAPLSAPIPLVNGKKLVPLSANAASPSAMASIDQDFHLIALRAADASLLKSWQLNGTQGMSQEYLQGFTLGNFTGNGLLQAAIQDLVYDPSCLSPYVTCSIYHSVMEVYDLGTPYNAATISWPMALHDPQNTAVIPSQVAVDTTPPSAPGLPMVSSQTATSFALSWSPAADNVAVAGYRLDISTTAGFEVFLPGLANYDVGNTTSTIMPGLTPSTTYYARLRAYDAALNMSTNSGITMAVTLPDLVPPSVPSPVFFFGASSSTLSLIWAASFDNVGVAGYKVDVSSSPTFAGFANGYANLDVGQQTSIVVFNLLPGTSYYARVRAYDVAGNVSTNSATVQDQTLSVPVVNLVISTSSLNTLAYIFSGSASDPRDLFSVTLNYGDGSPLYNLFPSTGSTAIVVVPQFHQYASSGSYTVILNATNLLGMVTSSSQTLTVTNPAPMVSFTATASSSNTLSYSFNGTVSDVNSVLSVLLNYGDGSPQNVANPVYGSTVAVVNFNHIYASSGTFTLTLTAQSFDGAVTVSTQAVVVANPPPMVSFTAIASSSNTLSYTFNGTVSDVNSVLSVLLNYGDNSPSNIANPVYGTTTTVVNFNHIYANSGTYNVTMTAQSFGGAVTISTQAVIVVNPVPGPAAFVTGKTFGSLRSSNVTGWLGYQFTVGPAPIQVVSLGRIMAPGNTGNDTVKLVQAANSVDVPGGSVSIPMAGGTVGQFVYGNLAAPVTLLANTSYYLVGAVAIGGDVFYDLNSTVTTTTAAVVNQAIYQLTVTGPAYKGALARTVYGPLDFRYTTVLPPAPTASAQSVTTAFNTAKGIMLTGTDPSGLTLTYAVTVNPTHGTLSGTAPNLTYRPANGYAGPDSFSFTANNGFVSSTAAVVSITINPMAPTITDFVQSKTLGNLRSSNVTGWLGYQFTVGPAPIQVVSLGRIMAPGNTGNDTVKLVQAANSVDIPGGSVSIPMAGGTVGQFVYGNLAAPVTLLANTSYYLVGAVAIGGDVMYDINSTVTTTTAAVVNDGIYQLTITGSGYHPSAPGQVYGPLDFQYAYTSSGGSGGNVETTTTGLANSLAGGISVNVYPNPWKPSLGVSFVQFKPVPDGSTIKIFTVSGHWVTTLSAPSGFVPWDLTNNAGQKVASGIYIYLVTDPQGNKVTGKVVVIR